MLRWVIVIGLIWFIVVNPEGAASVVHSITHFVNGIFTS
jgi:hypothetical protein